MDKIQWLKDVIYILPLVGLVWKAATQNAQIKSNAEDIKELKEQIYSKNDEIIHSLNKLNESIQAIRCEVEVIKALRKKEVEEEK